MSIIKTPPASPYEVLPRSTLQDKSIPLDAKGVLVFLLSLPPTWTLSVAWLRDQFDLGELKTARLMKDLERAKYLRRQKIRKEDGTWEWVSEVYREPYLG